MENFGRTTLYKAIKLPNGRLVVIDPDHLGTTSKVFDNRGDYELALANGWTDNPRTAMDRLEAAEDAISTDAAVRAFDDQHMTPAALAEVDAVESTTIAHLPEIPEGKKPRGRPRKV
jgi:hypothetical protein